jgi:hypothetical protein
VGLAGACEGVFDVEDVAFEVEGGAGLVEFVGRALLVVGDDEEGSAEGVEMGLGGGGGVGLGEQEGSALRVGAGQREPIGAPPGVHDVVVGIRGGLQPRRAEDAGVGAVGEVGAGHSAEGIVPNHRCW